jgi:hypothetical protein
MATASEPEFQRFPLDGKLYRLIHGGEVLPFTPDMATPQVRLWLAQIDESDPNHLKWTCRPSGSVSVLGLEEAAGSLPKMALGSFWRDRTLQTGHSMPNEMMVRAAVIHPQKWEVVYADQRIEGSGEYRIVPDEYPLEGEDAGGNKRKFQDAPLWRCVTESGLELLIPCYEIFRRFYGLTSELANAMLAGHWKRELSKLVDLEQTGLSDDGKTFQVTPRMDIRNIGCTGIAFFMAMATASERASEIYLKIDNARRSGIREPWIFAAPPWSDETMSIGFVGQKLRSGAVLVLWIYNSSFPHFPYAVTRIASMDPRQVKDDKAAPQVPEKTPKRQSPPRIKRPADSRQSRRAVQLGISENWNKLPGVKRLARKKIDIPFNPLVDSNALPKPLPLLSTGKRSRSGSAPRASLSSDEQNAIVDRFQALAECFEELLKTKGIVARSDYAKVDPILFGGREYCRFPMSIGNIERRWSAVDLKNPRQRRCWVSEIKMPTGALLYWFEIEAIDKDNFTSLVVKPRAPGSILAPDALLQILKMGVMSRGRWKNAALGTIEEQVVWLTVVHQFGEANQLRPSFVLSKLTSTHLA